MTEVRNLLTGSAQIYSCSAKQAVVAAYEQARKNNNTWQYPAFEAHSESVEGRVTVACGDFVCYKDGVTKKDIKVAIREMKRSAI